MTPRRKSPRAAARDDDGEDDLDGVEEHLGGADQREAHAQPQLHCMLGREMLCLLLCFITHKS